jgi:hypothetical protein
LVLAVVAATVAGGCETASTLTSSPDQVKCQVSMAAPSSVDAGGGIGTFAVTTEAECTWDVSTAMNWISGLSPTSGQGAGQVQFRVAPNEGTAAREGTILVNGNQVRISQPGAPCRFELGPASQNVNAAGGAGSVNVAATSGCSWSASTDVSWISLSAPLAGSGNGSVNFSVAANAGSERTGHVTIAGQRSTITQTAPGAGPAGPVPGGPGCTYTIAPSSQSIGAAGGAGTVAVSTQTGCSWTASSNASWITVASGASGSGNGSVAFGVALNIGPSRTGTLTIAGRTFTVTQAAVIPISCSYSISPDSQKMAKDGGMGAVTVSTNSGCAWTAASNTSWIAITSGASGTGDGTVTFTVERNDGKKRNGTLTVAGRSAKVEQEDK